MNHTSRNAPCPCGSGKRYKHCHGATVLRTRPAVANLSDQEREFVHALSLHQAGKLDEAEFVYARLLAANPVNPQVLHYLGVIHFQRNHYEEAEKCIRAALRTDATIPAYANLALVLRGQGKLLDALDFCDKAVAQDPFSAVSHNSRGLVLCDLQRYEEAVASCDTAIALDPRFAEALSNRGRALSEMGRYEEASTSYHQAMTIDPTLPTVAGHWVFSTMQCCSWEGFDDACAMLLNAVARNAMASVPFSLLAVPSSPSQQQRCARLYTQNRFPASRAPLWSGERYKHRRIRLGYLSADFHNHATAHMMAELFERHDRSTFEIIGISFGTPIRDSWRQRLERAFDRFHDVCDWTVAQIAALTRELEIDIAIDLKGHTREARLGIFALRPAPIQVNYLGYPGTIGADYIDYIIADRVVIPPEHEPYYDEKIVYLPHCYQVNDSTKKISDRRFSRAELGLPEDAFVWCCFNNTYKITPDVFNIWMHLLHAVDRSVLWLLVDYPTAAKNLRAEAQKRGVAPGRLVFAPRMELADHLARHQQADLFLDTFHVNAHTTASDALWAGLPLLTCRGESFAGRVASSLLDAVGLPELIACSHAEYEFMALELAANPTRLDAIRRKLAANRSAWPLFDTALFTKHIEAAYRLMVERHQKGMPPEHMSLLPAAR